MIDVSIPNQRVADFLLPCFQFASQIINHALTASFRRKIAQFPRIGLQIEQLIAVDVGVMDQLPAVGSNHSLEVAKVAEDVRMD